MAEFFEKFELIWAALWKYLTAAFGYWDAE